jgi:predicted RND superfamily exporter protein
MKLPNLTAILEALIFGHRRWIVGIFTCLTLFMAYSATDLHIDAGFRKHLPLKHEYMQTYIQYSGEFGGANRVLIALMAKSGDIFTANFFDTLEKVTDEVFFIPGVDRTKVSSLFTPDVRFTEVVEDGIAGGNVVPSDFSPTPEGLEQVRKNILKSGIVGRLVSNDFSGAIISAQLLEVNPNTGKHLDYTEVARQLEMKIRHQYQSDLVDIHIIGFSKVIGDITEGAMRVVLFFFVAFFITALLVYFYTGSFKVSVIPLTCSLVAVIWQLGLLTCLGYGIDPMGLLVPFLIFAIGVSHGVQMVTANAAEIYEGESSMDAARSSFRQLLIPGSIALASDTIGFVTIQFIEIRIIQEMAITASLGVAVIVLTNLVLLPVILSFINYSEKYRQKLSKRAERMRPVYTFLSGVCETRPSLIIITISVILMVFGIIKATDVRIGDLHSGVPELRADSRYNQDTAIITEHFSVGVDVISVIVETVPEGCIDYDIMTEIDRFAWHVENINGVQSVINLSGIAKIINSGWNEGSLKWRVLPRNRSTMVQAVGYVPTSSGLLNSDCSVMPVLIFTSDHKAETIDNIISNVKNYSKNHETGNVKFRLATGNVGVMAATNEEVKASQFPILMYVFLAVTLLCLWEFRAVRTVICIILPLGLVSLLAYALMSIMDIGLKVSTLPVVALGVGIGVDYGIYICSRVRTFRKMGFSLQEAYFYTLTITGNGVMFTGLTLAIGVITWIFSPLKFQADMGILLTFMFLVNMLGAIFLLPALARWLFPSEMRNTDSMMKP